MVRLLPLVFAACASAVNPAREAIDAAAESIPAVVGAWSCPMHPEVVQDHGGDCPKCGMALLSGG